MTARARATKRAAILDAAVRVFLEHGYEGASMELVATAAATVRRTVYNQFDNKEALFRAAVAALWQQIPSITIRDDPHAVANPELGLRRAAEMTVQFWLPERPVAFLRMVISESGRFPELADSYIRQGKLPALNGLIVYLDALRSNGHILCDDTELAARQFVGLINEPLLWYRVIDNGPAPDPAYCEAVIDEAVRTFLARYASREAPGDPLLADRAASLAVRGST